MADLTGKCVGLLFLSFLCLVLYAAEAGAASDGPIKIRNQFPPNFFFLFPTLEAARILKPGGQVLMAHWDWDSQVFDGTDKAAVRRLMHAFADWQQPWMDSADGWMGRRLWGLFDASSLFEGRPYARVMMNTVFAPPWYGHARAHDLRHLVTHGLARAADYERFLRDQDTLAQEGRYFYSITGYAYVGRRRAA